MSEFQRAIHQMMVDFEKNVDSAVQQGAEVYQEKLIEAYGKYQLSKSVLIQSGYLARTVLVDKDYASYLELGNNQNGPYIYPKNKKVLHFIVNGQSVFAHKVKTYAGKHIAENTLNANLGAIYSRINSSLGGKL